MILRLLTTSIVILLLTTIFLTSCATVDCEVDEVTFIDDVIDTGKPRMVYSIKKGNCK